MWQRPLFTMISSLIGAMLSLPLLAAPGDFSSRQEMYRKFESQRAFKFNLDQDLNKFPDDWFIEEGKGFKVYHKVMLDDLRRGVDDRSSLKFDFSGGRSGVKSAPLKLEKRYAYNISLWHQSKGLHRDFSHVLRFGLRAFDAKQNLIQEFSTSERQFKGEWAQTSTLRIELLPPKTHRCVLFVHIEGRPSGQSELLIDNVMVEASPRIRFDTGENLNTFDADQPIEFSQFLEGLEQGQTYEHKTEILDFMGQKMGETQSSSVVGTQKAVELITKVPSKDSGVYYIHASLSMDGKTLVRRREIVAKNSNVGDSFGNEEFGVLMGRPIAPFEPLLDSMDLLGAAVSKLDLVPQDFELGAYPMKTGFEELNPLLKKWAPDRGYQFIGVLNLPPEDAHPNPYRPAKHVVETFSSHAETWTPVLDDLVLNYGDVISDWQIGRDEQSLSEVQLEGASAVMDHLRSQTEWMNIILPGFEGDLQEKGGFSKNLYIPSDITDEALQAMLKNPKLSNLTVTVQLGSSQDMEQLHIIEDMVRRFTILKSALDSRGEPLVKRLFIDRLLGENVGLMTESYQPQSSYFAAKTLIYWMKGAEVLGEIENPDHDVRCIAFGRGSEAFAMLWRKNNADGSRPKVKDVTYHLGSGIKVLDLMGNRARVLESQGGQLIPVGPTPLMITTPHRQLWETMMSFRLQNASTRAKVKLQPQSLTWKNVFSEQAKFDVVMNYPQGWEVVPDRTSMEVANATGGTFAYQMAPSPLSPLNLGVPVFLDVEISMPRAHHKVRLYREDTLVSDVELDVSFYKDTEVAGALKCVVAVNLSSEARGASTFIVSAQLPNGEVMETFFKGVMPGDRRQNSLFILDGTALIGKELTLTARENIGQRYLNARFPIQPVF